MRPFILITGFTLFFSFFATPAFCKILYVDGAIGNDGFSYAANGESTPWSTIGRAVWGSGNRNAPNSGEAARAGDLVIVKTGVYSTSGTGTRYEPQWNPVNSGTPGNPIVIRSQGVVELRQSGGDGPLIGVMDRDYIEWEGFFIDEVYYTYHPDTGPVLLSNTTGSAIRNMVIKGKATTEQDNHNGIRCEYATNCVVENNKIHGIQGGSLNHNTSGIMLYFCDGIIIQNNEIFDTISGIFPKGGSNRNITIRYNLIHDLVANPPTVAIRVSHTSNSNIYQNVIYNTTLGIQIAEGTTSLNVYNNTIDGNLSENTGIYHRVSTGCSNLRYRNNLTTMANESVNFDFADRTIFDIDYNLYFQFDQFVWNSAPLNFLQWQTSVSGDGHSLVSDPQYVDRSAHDYRLRNTSQALNAGENGTPVGAYITGTETIGLTSLPPEPPPADPPPVQGSTGGGGCSISGTMFDSTNTSNIDYLLFLIMPALLFFVRGLYRKRMTRGRSNPV